MALTKQKLLHKRSSVVGRILPTSALTYGEIAVNFSSGANNSFLETKKYDDTPGLFFIYPYGTNALVANGVEDGYFSASTSGITSYFDGLTVKVKLNGHTYNENWNTLNINGIGPKLIWYRYNQPATIQYPINSEVTLTYRTDAGSYVATANERGLISGQTYTDGWVAQFVPDNGIDAIISGINYTIKQDEFVISAALNDLNDRKQDLTERVTTINSTSTDDEYPTAKAVYDIVNGSVATNVDYKGATSVVPATSQAGDMYIAANAIALTAAQSATGAAATAETGDFLIARSSGKWDIIQKNLDGAVTTTAVTLTDGNVLVGGGNHTTKVSNYTIGKSVPSTALFTDSATTETGHYTPGTTASTLGSTTAGNFLQTVILDSKKHVISATTATALTSYTEASLSVANSGSTNSAAQSVVYGITTGGTKGHSLTLQRTNKVYSASTSDISYVGQSYIATGTVRGVYNVTIPNVTALTEGMNFRVKLSGVTYNNNWNSLKVNNLDPVPLWYFFGTKMTSHYGANAELDLTYRNTATSSPLIPTDSNSGLTSGVSYTNGFIIESVYLDGNNTYDNRAYYGYYRSDENGINAYQLCAIDTNEKLTPLVLSGGTGTTKPVNTKGFHPEKIFYMNISSRQPAYTTLTHGTIYWSVGTSTGRYTFNGDWPAYTTGYLKGTLKDDGLFYLSTGVTDFYRFVPYTSATTMNLSNYFENGFYYIRFGRSYSSANYYYLDPINPLFYYDGTNLIEITPLARKAFSATTSINAGYSQYLQTWKMDPANGTYGEQYPVRARWITNSDCKIEVSGYKTWVDNANSATTSTSASTASSSVSATTSKSATTASSSVSATTSKSATTSTSASTASSSVSATTSKSATTSTSATTASSSVSATTSKSATTSTSASTAASAAKTANSLKIYKNGTLQVTFDGSSSLSALTTDTAATYSGHYTPTSANSQSTVSGARITGITRDGKGHILSIATAATDNVDTKVTDANGTAKAFLLGHATQASNATAVSNANVYMSAGTVSMTELKLAEKAKMVYNTTNNCIDFVFI